MPHPAPFPWQELLGSPILPVPPSPAPGGSGPQSTLPPAHASPQAEPTTQLIRACLQPAGLRAEDFWEGISGNEDGSAESFLICRSYVCFVRIPTASNELNEAAGHSLGRFQEKRDHGGGATHDNGGLGG